MVKVHRTTTTGPSKWMAGFGVLALLAGILFLAAPSAGAGNHEGRAPENDQGNGQGNNSEDTVTIDLCHRTNSASNPYVKISVNFNSTDGSVAQGPDHTGHSGPVFDPDTMTNGDDWGDIIPPFGDGFGGQNWTADGQAIFNNGCAIPTGGSGSQPPSGGNGSDPEDPVVIDDVVETASLQIVKAVEGEDAPEDWAYDFTGDLGSFTLNDTGISNTEGGLDPGSYTVTEVPDDVAELTDISCTGASATADLGAGSVTVDLAEGDDAQCTFTNTYPETVVLDDEVVNTPEPGPQPDTEVLDEVVENTPAPQPETEVLPEVVERTTLPRTGINETQNLAGVGLVLLGLGMLLIGTTRRELATQS